MTYEEAINRALDRESVRQWVILERFDLRRGAAELCSWRSKDVKIPTKQLNPPEYCRCSAELSTALSA